MLGAQEAPGSRRQHLGGKNKRETGPEAYIYLFGLTAPNDMSEHITAVYSARVGVNNSVTSPST